jgi:hypothetical protein
MAEFAPKQLSQCEASHLTSLQGDVSETVTSYLPTLTPPITTGSIIHNNACGAGAVTKTIRNPNPTFGITINVTDVNPQFVTACAATSESNS